MLNYIGNRYNIKDHYWAINGNTALVYSTAKAAFVSIDDVDYINWLNSGLKTTEIANIDELKEVILNAYPEGWGISDSASQVVAIDKTIAAVCLNHGWSNTAELLAATASGQYPGDLPLSTWVLACWVTVQDKIETKELTFSSDELAVAALPVFTG